jgi:P-type Cu+ transporter
MSTFYTSTAHPDVCSLHLASCPECGSALRVGSSAALERAQALELSDLSRRVAFAAAFSSPVVLLALGERVPPLAALIPVGLRGWLELALAAPVCLWAAWPFYVRAAQARRNRTADMFTLIAVGVGVAYGYSVLAQLVPGLFPASFRNPDGRVAVYFGVASMMVTLVLLGQVLELSVRGQTFTSLRALRDLAARVRRVSREDSAEQEVPIDRIQVGDRLRVMPGERVPVDGVVVEGASAVDESVLSGEPGLISKRSGDELIGGTFNATGSLIMKAQNVGDDTLLACIVERVAAAQHTPAALQGRAEVLTRYLVPAVLVGAAATFALWTALGPQPRLALALLSGIAVTIIASPYALALAAPMSILMAMGRGARAGVLFRGAEEIERLAAIDTLVVDKTSTLTEGRPALAKLLPLGKRNEDELLQLAATLERASDHPLALALVRAARDRGLSFGEVRDLRFTTGKGFAGVIDERPVALGSRAFLGELGIDVRALAEASEPLCREGHTVIHLAVDGAPAGSLAFVDAVRPTTAGAVQALRAEGVHIVLLTGDDGHTARALADAVGIVEVIAEVQPLEKVDAVRRVQSAGRMVAVAGRGIEDVQALAQAQVGIALGSQGDLALERAEITLVRGDLRGIARARRLARRTLRNARQNFGLALAYNAIALPIAAGALYPLLGWLLDPMLAAAAMSASSVAIMANALRLRNIAL